MGCDRGGASMVSSIDSSAKRRQKTFVSRHGYVKALAQIDTRQCAAGRHPVRQFHVMKHLGEALEKRVMQRRAQGLRDEECLRLKVLTSMLPQI